MAEDPYAQRDRRILDAAADLVLRWGAKRVTIDEVARHAGIGKGTVYLHFESRARLLDAMLMRESVAITDELIAAIERDPVAVLPGEQARLTYLIVHRRPLSRAMMTRDRDLLGELAHEQAVRPLAESSRTFGHEFFALLRDHGLLRADQEPGTQELIFGAIQTGFYLNPAAAELAPEATANALRDTIAATLQPPEPPDPTRLESAASQAVARYRRLRDDLADEIARRPERSR
ncbi:TetR/AcrR family transcriptional regulator [Microlunatus parietis]|uniref:AcrR family transcriptional regulator n=1 Tax=Microlunatus parietis TaxID=682979 RepID=A0A7Y9IDU2_9ACTN|nr:TetR/AcrR family transcriptional regulator [Microlunatus parietis]NYE75042.1 AcrR family transcriptional regulator [Microlunatus parietis]